MKTMPAESLEIRRLLTSKVVADRLGLTEAELYRAVREGVVPAVRIGRRLRFDPVRLNAWLEAGGQALPGGWRREAD